MPVRGGRSAGLVQIDVATGNYDGESYSAAVAEAVFFALSFPTFFAAAAFCALTEAHR